MIEYPSITNNSECVYFSDFVVSSTCVYDCFGLVDCECVKNCIFCKGIKCKEYMIFNKQVTKERFEEIFGRIRVHKRDILDRNEVLKDACLMVLIKPMPEYNEKLFNEIEKQQAQVEFGKMETQLLGVTKDKIREIRHKVCDEIKNELLDFCGYDVETKKWVASEDIIEYIIDKIEKGE